ncbi:hypothetical protein [Pimelobacter simplex]|uniref:hypothetical protein n=1 Tax=Nocardioides simplex TaxID=2045 RepID=UPI00215046E1|nr:hypothetical protein [Pimelobacter simplex]UUW88096.1 hypothetical protein M0M43_20460 [Pimelobacter simplex]UUW97600.1 hypothetical protein M0M48_09105 [Pimelobacter simplex]
MRAAPPTASESEFFDRLSALVRDAQDWYHVDHDGTLWMTASYDDMIDGVLAATWRIDFDGLELVGGKSPAYLNWDDGVRGRATGMSLEPPDGLVASVSSAEQAAQVAAHWFDQVTHGRAST